MTPRIAIALPADRRRPGTLSLLEGGVLVAGPWECLGRAAGELAAALGNPARDPLRHNGDTPLGEYGDTGVEPHTGPGAGIGARWIPLRPVAGDALTAALAGREGLAIHAGRPRRADGSLMPTAGCVRMDPADFAALCAAIGPRRVTVVIEQGE